MSASLGALAVSGPIRKPHMDLLESKLSLGMKTHKQLHRVQFIWEVCFFKTPPLACGRTEQMERGGTIYLGTFGQLCSSLLLIWPWAIIALATGANWTLN